jgi:hypothetical protein
LTNRTLKIPNRQLNRNTKFYVFGHLKKNRGGTREDTNPTYRYATRH